MEEAFHEEVTVHMAISWDDAKRLYQEFLIYLVMHVMMNENLVPPKNIEVIWNLYLAKTRLYRDFCIRVFGDLVLPKPYSYNQKGIDEMASDYQNAVDFYTKACGREPNYLVWRYGRGTSVEAAYTNVNILRMAHFRMANYLHHDR